MLGGCNKGKDCGKDGSDKPYTGQKNLGFFGSSSILTQGVHQSDGLYLDQKNILSIEHFQRFNNAQLDMTASFRV